MTSPRAIAGRMWLSLVVKHYLACRDADEPRRQKLFDLLDGLTDEYPEQVEAEIKAFLGGE